MSTELSRVAPPRQLTLPTRDIADLVTLYLNHVERESYSQTVIGVEIPAKDRTALSARLCHIDAVCVPRQEDGAYQRGRIDKAVSYMISMFTVGRKISAQEAAGTVKGYVIALDGVPAHFVEQACLDFAQGRVMDHDKAFTPTSAQVRARAKELMIPFYEEAAKIRVIISSKRIFSQTPEERERMRAKCQAVIDGTDPDIKAIKDRMEADRMIHLERQTDQIGRSTTIQRRRYCEHYGVDPDGLASPALMQTLYGRMTPKAQPEQKKALAK